MLKSLSARSRAKSRAENSLHQMRKNIQTLCQKKKPPNSTAEIAILEQILLSKPLRPCNDTIGENRTDMHGASQSLLLAKEVTTHFGVAQSPLTLVLLLSWPEMRRTKYDFTYSSVQMLGCQILCEDSTYVMLWRPLLWAIAVREIPFTWSRSSSLNCSSLSEPPENISRAVG